MKAFKLFTLFIFILLVGCSKDEEIPNNENPDGTPQENITEYSLGWLGNEDLSKVPTATNFGFGNENVPSSYDMIDKFPPIGNQNPYGTCVSWAVAYNAKTAMSGMDRKLSLQDLSSSRNQFSPKDLFTAIPNDSKGKDCNGTNFSFALDVLQNRGVATLATVPYDNLGDCLTNNVDPNWTQEANNYKIQYWRKVDPSTNAIKQNISKNIPVIVGARLADNFMSWNSDDVLTSHSTFTNVGQHAYHAMVIGGYDDNKGPNGAFKVINSWGTGWGDFGYIWVGYNFFFNGFNDDGAGGHSIFIMANQDGENVSPPQEDDTKPQASGVDLAPWVFDDYSTYDWSDYSNEREIDFNLYNIGNAAATPNANWNVYYIYYNAYDANDYGVLFYDEFNTSIAAETFDCPTANNCVVNTSISAHSDFAYEAFGYESITRTYFVPEISGEYYLMMVADASNVFEEEDELNNYFYTSAYPMYFNQGYAAKGDDVTTRMKVDKNADVLVDKSHQTAENGMQNAYTQQEIANLIRVEKANGNLDKKVAEYNLVLDNKEMYQTNKSSK